MIEKELLDGDSSKRPRDDDNEEDEQDGDDDELDDGDDGGPGPSGGKASKKPLEAPEGIFDDKDPEEMTLQELIDAQPDHWKSGKAGDGKIYLNDDGEKVKLNVKGNPYKIGEDGRRLFKTSLRPKGTYSPEEWRKLSQSDRNVILKAEKKKLEKKEADEKNKRKIEEVKKKSLKKEKKDSKKDKGMSKPKDDDEKDDEGGQDDPHSKSKKSDAGVGEVMKNKVTLPITCTSAYLDMYDIVDDDDIHGKRYIDCRKIRRSADASPCSDASTDVPDDEEYLTEWDEWSEVEKGRGPKASWSGEVWNTLSGAISKSSTATPGESTMIKNGKCVNVKSMKNTTTDDDDDFIAFPTMPCTSAPSNIHRTKVPPGGLGESSSTPWFPDQSEEQRLNPILKQRKQCSRNGKDSEIKKCLISQWFENMMMWLRKPRRTRRKFIWLEFMVYVLRRITNCLKVILVESSKEEVFCWAIK